MTPVLMRARAELRTRWKAWVSLTVMLGLFGGAVIAIAAGARRTNTAYERFLASSHAFDLGVPVFSVSTPLFGQVKLTQLEHLPQVAEHARIRLYEGTGETSLDAPMDARAYTEVERPKMLAGRLPRTVNE